MGDFYFGVGHDVISLRRAPATVILLKRGLCF